MYKVAEYERLLRQVKEAIEEACVAIRRYGTCFPRCFSLSHLDRSMVFLHGLFLLSQSTIYELTINITLHVSQIKV